jgi:OOP family OmpA-OmpF porin
VEIDLVKPWYRDNRFSPYLLAGYGYQKSDRSGGQDDEDGGAGTLGFGILTDFKRDGSLALRTELRQRWDFGADTTYQDLVLNIGLQIPFGGKKEPMAVADPDSDGDGVPDSRDMCPGTPSGVKVNSNGCPLDSDGDGVADYLDKCPGTPPGTLVDSTGCPMDSDGDGVPDTADDCPGTPAGVRVDVHGCEIKAIAALADVEFRHDSDQLTDASRAALADEAASVRKYPDMKVQVAGHTDSSGAEEYNQALSERRAQSVSDYLVSEGVNPDNLTVKGYGESDPIADNSTAEGRASNRRVELRIQN